MALTCILIAAVLYLVREDQSTGNPPDVNAVGLCASEPESAAGVRVEGNRFVSDGKTWIPRALNIERYTALPQVTRSEGPGIAASLDRWDQHECELMKEFGANALRIQVGQPSIDPQSPRYDRDYAAMVDRRVRDALDSGFIVDLSLQWQRPDDAPKQSRPDRNSVKIWHDLATKWGDDPRVIFELYNEPMGDPTPENWNIWLHGGPYAKNPSGQSVGIQTLIDTVRSAGAKNALLLPGLRLEKTLQGVPADQVVDPLNNFGFAFHTPDLSRGEAGLNTRIGYLAQDYPLWATEQVGGSPWKKCYEEMDEDYVWYFPWLVKNGIGVTSPWDRRAVWGDTFGKELTTFDNFSCRPAHQGISGPGEMFHELFLNGYPR